jgi:ribosomal protein S18 acetylase RimI-like enzyme
VNQGIDIGPLVEQDMEALALLYRQFWGEGSAVEKMRATFRRLQADDHYLFLAARREGHLVGSVMGIVCEELYGECRPFLLIEDLVADEAWRRIGIGATLMRTLERHAADRDCAYILFITEADRDRALRFYGSLGYECGPYRGFKKRLDSG